MLTAVANSGGHVHHDNNRPKGTLTATSGSTGTNGFSTIYTSPEVGGVIELQVNLVFPPVPPATEGQPFSFVRTFGITVPNLVPLPPGNYTPTGAITGQHTDNRYGLQAMNEAVLFLADEYKQVFGSQPGFVPIGFNDMSLVQGGLFDVYGTNTATIWQPPHRSHRFGDDIDVDMVPPANRRRLVAMALLFNLERVPEPTIHFRLR